MRKPSTAHTRSNLEWRQAYWRDDSFVLKGHEKARERVRRREREKERRREKETEAKKDNETPETDAGRNRWRQTRRSNGAETVTNADGGRKR